jgi:heterodisulfide reductase subunit C/nitrate reductase gamma subunit
MTPALFRIALYGSLAICLLGLLWRVSTWFHLRVGPDACNVTVFQRLITAVRGAVSVTFSRGLVHVLRAFFVDVVFQNRLFAREKLRWLGHQLILTGFTGLVLVHALASVLAGKLSPGYQPTLDPYMFLRNLAGVMVFVGIAMVFAGRRRQQTGFPQSRRPIDAIFVALLGTILVSGFLLEAHKIASPRAFYRMTDQFIGTTDPEELKPLRALWASEFGVAFDDMGDGIEPAVIAEGRELHGDACASCHAKPTSAFISYTAAKVLAPLSGALDEARADTWLLYLHLFACFIGLALLPFSRFFHAVADPVSLLVNGAAREREFSSAGRASRRALALDACVHCGLCDSSCSVGPLARHLGNPALLPSHKIVATGAHARRRLLSHGIGPDALLVSEGAFQCTDCGRCTTRCPVGLDLADLWEAGRGDLAIAGLPAPSQWVQARSAFAWAESLDSRSTPDAPSAPLASDRRTFSHCVQCQTCTNVCPVVAHSIDTEHGVDLTPQKVMNLLRLGMLDLTLGSRMVWDCATCYQCQENCPEGVRVTDVMCELRGLAYHRLGSVRNPGGPS